MADPKSQSKGFIDSKDESTDKLITQNIPEINVHHKVEEGVCSSGEQQQNGTNTAAAVTLTHDGGIIGSDRQEVECHHSMSGEQEVELHSNVSGEQEVQYHSSVSGEQEVQSHSSVSGEQEVQSHSSVSGKQEVRSHSSVSGEQEVQSHSSVSGEQEVQSHSGVSGEQEVQSHSSVRGELEVQSHSSVRGELEVQSPSSVSGKQVVEGDIFEAAQSGDITMVANYLDLGFPPDLTDEEGWSILHHAASHGQVEVIKLLHERGCCIDPVDRHGRTPLHHAATSGEAASIGVLVDLGGNVNTVDSEGNTPLKWAVMCEKYSTLEELLKYGGVEDVECEQRKQPSDEQRKEFITALDEETVHSLLTQSASTGDVQTVSAILDHGCPVDAVDSDGYTALHRAAEGGHVEVIRELIARGASFSVETNKLNHLRIFYIVSDANDLPEIGPNSLELSGRPLMTKIGGINGTPLHLAVWGGHKEVVLALLDAGYPIDVVDCIGRNVLHTAAQYGHVELLGLLVERGLDVNGGDADGYTPLHLAAANGTLKAVHELLRLGGKASMTKVAGTGGTPLHLAALGGHKEIVLGLLGAGFPINVVTSVGQNILHFAAQGGHVELLGLLIEHGLDVNGGDTDDYTPLHSAAVNGKLEAVHELLKLGAKPSLTKVAGTGGTPLHQAVLGGHKEVVSVLLDGGCPINVLDGNGRNVLHTAAQCGHVELLGLLIERGLDVNGGDADDYTPLHSAAVNGKQEAVHELLRLGTKPSLTKVAGTGGTPLHQAVLGGHKEVVSVLLDGGCPINVVDGNGRNVLHTAAQCGHVNLIGLLVERGLDVNVGEDANDGTPLHFAAANGKLEAVHELLRLGGKPSMTKVAGSDGIPLHQAACGGHKEVVLGLLDEGCPIDTVGINGGNVLHAVAQGGHVDLIRLLVERGLDVSGGDADGCTPLHFAAAYGKLEAVYELLRLGGKASMTKVAGTMGIPLHQAVLGGHKEVVLALLDAGCPLDVVTSVGRNVLHFAVQGGHVDVIGLLVERGLDVNRGDADNYTPLHLAAVNGKLEAVHELLRLGGKASLTKVAGTDGTPLHQAVLGGHKEVMLVLLDGGCPINVVDSNGRNVLDFAVGHVDLIGLLVERGLDVNGGDADGYTPLHSASANGKLEAVHELLRLGGKASLTKVASNGGFPVHQAVMGGHKEVVLALLDAGCSINEVDNKGRNVLHAAAQCGHVDLIGWLVERGLDVSKGDADDRTPLRYAADKGELEAVHELLKLAVKTTSGLKLDIRTLHSAVRMGHVEVVSTLLDAMEQYRSLLISGNQGSEASQIPSHSSDIDGVDRADKLSQAPVDYCDEYGQTALMLAAETDQVAVFNLLLSRNSDSSARDHYELTAFEHAVMYGHIDKLTKFSTYQGSEASIIECVLALNSRKLLDPRKLLILGSFTGDPLVITTLSSDESMFSQAADYQWPMACRIAFNAMSKESSSKLRLPDQGPLTALHIALLMFKEVRDNSTEDESIKSGAKDYGDFIEKLISHPLTKDTVNELFPNGLSPLDIARRFDFHDVANMIERAGGGPGQWANLPKEMEQKNIAACLAVKGLIGYGEQGIEAISMILSFVGYQSVGEESSEVNRILRGRPSRSLVLKHVMSRLQHKDKWERVGDLLEVDEEELDRLGEKATSDDEAYYSMLKYWLKHGHQVTWKTLLDAVGHFETKKTVDDMTHKIVEELAPLQVSLIEFHFKS